MHSEHQCITRHACITYVRAWTCVARLLMVRSTFSFRMQHRHCNRLIHDHTKKKGGFSDLRYANPYEREVLVFEFAVIWGC
jgi:hypothetical protein